MACLVYGGDTVFQFFSFRLIDQGRFGYYCRCGIFAISAV
jgi:hypothetical protein